MGAVADAGATKGVLGDAGTACDSERGGMADGRARVPEVLAPAELGDDVKTRYEIYA